MDPNDNADRMDEDNDGGENLPRDNQSQIPLPVRAPADATPVVANSSRPDTPSTSGADDEASLSETVSRGRRGRREPTRNDNPLRTDLRRPRSTPSVPHLTIPTITTTTSQPSPPRPLPSPIPPETEPSRGRSRRNQRRGSSLSQSPLRTVTVMRQPSPQPEGVAASVETDVPEDDDMPDPPPEEDVQHYRGLVMEFRELALADISSPPRSEQASRAGSPTRSPIPPRPSSPTPGDRSALDDHPAVRPESPTPRSQTPPPRPPRAAQSEPFVTDQNIESAIRNNYPPGREPTYAQVLRAFKEALPDFRNYEELRRSYNRASERHHSERTRADRLISENSLLSKLLREREAAITDLTSRHQQDEQPAESMQGVEADGDQAEGGQVEGGQVDGGEAEGGQAERGQAEGAQAEGGQVGGAQGLSEDAQKALDESRRESFQLARDLDVANTENEDLRGRNARLDRRCKNLQLAAGNQSQQIQAYTAMIETKRRENAALKADLEHAQEENVRIKQLYQAMTNQRDTATKQIADLLDENERLRRAAAGDIGAQQPAPSEANSWQTHAIELYSKRIRELEALRLKDKAEHHAMMAALKSDNERYKAVAARTRSLPSSQIPDMAGSDDPSRQTLTQVSQDERERKRIRQDDDEEPEMRSDARSPARPRQILARSELESERHHQSCEAERMEIQRQKGEIKLLKAELAKLETKNQELQNAPKPPQSLRTVPINDCIQHRHMLQGYQATLEERDEKIKERDARIRQLGLDLQAQRKQSVSSPDCEAERKQIVELKAKIDELNAEIMAAQIKNSLNTDPEMVGGLRDEIASLEAQIEQSAIVYLTDTSNMRAEAQEYAAQRQQEINQKQQEIEQLKALLQVGDQERRSYVEAASQEIERYQKVITELQAEINRLNGDLSQLQNRPVPDCDEEKQKIAALENELRDLQQRLSNAENNARTAAQEAAATVDHQEQEMAALKTQIGNANEEIQCLRAAAQSSESAPTPDPEKEEEIQILKSELAKCNVQLKEITATCEQLRKENKTLSSEIAAKEISARNEQLNSNHKVQKLEDQLVHERAALKTARKKVVDLQEELEQMSASIATQPSMMQIEAAVQTEAAADSSSLIMSGSQRDRELISARVQLSDSQFALQKEREKVESLKQDLETEKARNVAQSVEPQIGTLQLQSTLEIELAEAQDTIEQLQARLTEVEDQRSALESQQAELESQLSIGETTSQDDRQVIDPRKTIADLQNTVEEQRQRIHDLQAAEQAVKWYEDEVHNLKSNLASCEEHGKELTSRINQLTEIIRHLPHQEAAQGPNPALSGIHPVIKALEAQEVPGRTAYAGSLPAPGAAEDSLAKCRRERDSMSEEVGRHRRDIVRMENDVRFWKEMARKEEERADSAVREAARWKRVRAQGAGNGSSEEQIALKAEYERVSEKLAKLQREKLRWTDTINNFNVRARELKDREANLEEAQKEASDKCEEEKKKLQDEIDQLKADIRPGGQQWENENRQLRAERDALQRRIDRILSLGPKFDNEIAAHKNHRHWAQTEVRRLTALVQAFENERARREAKNSRTGILNMLPNLPRFWPFSSRPPQAIDSDLFAPDDDKDDCQRALRRLHIDYSALRYDYHLLRRNFNEQQWHHGAFHPECEQDREAELEAHPRPPLARTRGNLADLLPREAPIPSTAPIFSPRPTTQRRNSVDADMVLHRLRPRPSTHTIYPPAIPQHEAANLRSLAKRHRAQYEHERLKHNLTRNAYEWYKLEHPAIPNTSTPLHPSCPSRLTSLRDALLRTQAQMLDLIARSNDDAARSATAQALLQGRLAQLRQELLHEQQRHARDRDAWRRERAGLRGEYDEVAGDFAALGREAEALNKEMDGVRREEWGLRRRNGELMERIQGGEGVGWRYEPRSVGEGGESWEGEGGGMSG